MTFLGQLIQCLPDPAVHRVEILATDRIEVDGVQTEITRAALHALMALVLLRDEPDFSLENFARLYRGRDTGDAKTDFDNAMRALKRELPKTTPRVSSNKRRRISEIKILSHVGNAVITRRLLYYFTNINVCANHGIGIKTHKNQPNFYLFIG